MTTHRRKHVRPCVKCGRRSPDLIALRSTHPELVTWISADVADGTDPGDRICTSCLNRERIAHTIRKLEQERGELTAIESQIALHAASHLAIARNAQKSFESTKTLGNRISDGVAAIGGSWTFVIGFFGVLAVWIVINAAISRAFDPYPFILLNLVLSTLAAVQAPIIMMSQNRSANRDRIAAQNDYEVNLKAEVEIRELHDKLDALRDGQWVQLVAQQEEQIKLLSLLCAPTSSKP